VGKVGRGACRPDLAGEGARRRLWARRRRGRVWSREEHGREEGVGRTRLLIPLVSPKDLLHSPQPFKEALGYIYRQPTKRYLVAKHRGKIEIKILSY
jgi:hypothetical protein